MPSVNFHLAQGYEVRVRMKRHVAKFLWILIDWVSGLQIHSRR